MRAFRTRRGFPIRRSFPGGAVALAASLALGAPLAACSNVDRTVATASIPDDYHQRHPVMLADTRQTLDVFLVSNAKELDFRQARDVTAFAADFRVHGEGRILVQVPRGPGLAGPAEATLQALRRSLAGGGVKGNLEVGSYRVLDPALAAPVRLSFTKLQARLASRCGEWPDDLGSGTTLHTWENRTYYNFGCSTQQTLAAQIDDPRDLVRPRAQDPSDVLMRTRAIESIRQGADPSTHWSAGYTSIGGIGGQ